MSMSSTTTVIALTRPGDSFLLQNTRAQIALMRPDRQTRALWEMFSDLMDLDDAHRYVADMRAGMDVRYDLGDDHRLVGTLCPDTKLTLERPGPDIVTAVTRSADPTAVSPGPCLPGGTSTPPRWCVRWAPGSATRPEHRINRRLRFARYEVGIQISDATRM
ncbi:hypothetical protein Z951_15515 [Streptomyces sp. PRh5]|uniref:hypothetical protein n=1 Tax=Streptomyces sp. PRh5 TaxID=1158056 RepID=UPI00044FFC85|nr:hypothetical protein [Streptomyces sp. PRh5]EXU67326.1 hypothetical protein Z951_15515 [Streptomyces sp. PRh5]